MKARQQQFKATLKERIAEARKSWDALMEHVQSAHELSEQEQRAMSVLLVAEVCAIDSRMPAIPLMAMAYDAGVDLPPGFECENPKCAIHGDGELWDDNEEGGHVH